MKDSEDKPGELARAKRRALLLLAGAAGLFLMTLGLPPQRWVLALRAVTEAAMVGGLADWFAVAALFRRIPTGIPYITAHTNVISNNKDRIADNLAAFVKERFLDPESLVALIRKNDPARFVAQWLSAAANAQRLGTYLARSRARCTWWRTARIEQLLRDAARGMLLRRRPLRRRWPACWTRSPPTAGTGNCWSRPSPASWPCWTGPSRASGSRSRSCSG